MRGGYKHFLAVLHGGPCDGKIVKMIGCYYETRMEINGRMLTAFYEWGQERDGRMFGTFRYYRNRAGEKVDKRGRKRAAR